MAKQRSRRLIWVTAIVAAVLVSPIVMIVLTYGLLQQHPAVAECRKINAALQDLLDSQPQFQDYELAPCYESLASLGQAQAAIQVTIGTDQGVVEALELSQPLLERLGRLREEGAVVPASPVAIHVRWLHHGTAYQLNLDGLDTDECTNFTASAETFADLDGVESVEVSCHGTKVDWGKREKFPHTKELIHGGNNELNVVHRFSVGTWDIRFEGIPGSLQGVDYPFDDLLEATIAQPAVNVDAAGERRQVEFDVSLEDNDPQFPFGIYVSGLNGSESDSFEQTVGRMRAFVFQHSGIGNLTICGVGPDRTKYPGMVGASCYFNAQEPDPE